MPASDAIDELRRRLLPPASLSSFLATWLNGKLLEGEEQTTLLAYYKSYVSQFGEYCRYHYDNQSAEILTLIRQLGSPRVLEVGCGCGTESLYFALLGADVVGIDLRSDRLRVARARKEVVDGVANKHVHCDFRLATLFDMRDELFDIIWMEQALHHVEPRMEAVSHIAGLLKPGGYLVISEVNGLNPLLQAQLLLRRGTKTIGSFVDELGRRHPYGIERVMSVRHARNTCKRAGLEIIDSRLYRCFPNRGGADRLKLLDRWCPQFLFPAFTHFNLVARKPDWRISFK